MFYPEYFGYGEQIVDAMRLEGYEVDNYDERPSNGFVGKALVRLGIGLYRPFQLRRIKRIIEEHPGKQYDYVFVIKGEAINEEVIALLRQAYPKARFILYLWDAVSNFRNGKRMIGQYDRVLTFDPVDAQKYQILFRPMFYGPGFEEEAGGEQDYDYDIAFIGTAHSIRPRIVKQVRTFCEENNLRFFSFLYSPHTLVDLFNRVRNPDYRWAKRSEIHFQPMEHDEMQRIYRRSRCILDVEHPGQQGITTRPLEMLRMQKKIITTNQLISGYDFFRSENYLVINPDAPKIDIAFLESSFVPVSKALLDQYSVQGFIRDVFLTET